MLKVGLTGNIGSGKSTVAKVFNALGVPVFYADYEARQCYFIPDVHEKVVSAFGAESYLRSDKINAPYIADMVFTDPLALAQLNGIIHPALRTRFSEWCDSVHCDNYPYVMMEAAILFENDFHHLVDTTVCVYASRKQRINRVTKRDNLSVEQIEQRMNNQWSDEKIRDLSDFCINNRDKQMILQQIQDLHEIFLEKAGL